MDSQSFLIAGDGLIAHSIFDAQSCSHSRASMTHARPFVQRKMTIGRDFMEMGRFGPGKGFPFVGRHSQRI
jgi:hypothetical protein